MRLTPALVSLEASFGRALTELETALALDFWVAVLGLEVLPVLLTYRFPLVKNPN